MNADRAADLRDFYKSTLDNERLNCATGGPVEHLFWLTSNVAPPGNGRRSANRSTVLCLTGQGHWSVKVHCRLLDLPNNVLFFVFATGRGEGVHGFRIRRFTDPTKMAVR